jgi:hypothetical protein
MVTLRTEAENIDESQTTLRFAQRAKAVKTKVKDNTVTVLDSAKLLKEVEALPSPNPNPNPNRNPNPNPDPDPDPNPNPNPNPQPYPYPDFSPKPNPNPNQVEALRGQLNTSNMMVRPLARARVRARARARAGVIVNGAKP